MRTLLIMVSDDSQIQEGKETMLNEIEAHVTDAEELAWGNAPGMVLLDKLEVHISRGSQMICQQCM